MDSEAREPRGAGGRPPPFLLEPRRRVVPAARALQGAEAPAWGWGSRGVATGDKRAPSREPHQVAQAPSQSLGHLPTTVPGAVRRPAQGQQDEETEQMHRCQRHVPAARTEGLLPPVQQPTECPQGSRCPRCPRQRG